MDWNTDPELKAMRGAFLSSFVERKCQLGDAVRALNETLKDQELGAVLESIRHIAHKLAGAAESYGFSGITEVSAALDDWLSHSPESEKSDLARIAGYVTLLSEVLDDALAKQSDPVFFRDDSRFTLLMAAAATVRSRF